MPTPRNSIPRGSQASASQRRRGAIALPRDRFGAEPRTGLWWLTNLALVLAAVIVASLVSLTFSEALGLAAGDDGRPLSGLLIGDTLYTLIVFTPALLPSAALYLALLIVLARGRPERHGRGLALVLSPLVNGIVWFGGTAFESAASTLFYLSIPLAYGLVVRLPTQPGRRETVVAVGVVVVALLAAALVISAVGE